MGRDRELVAVLEGQIERRQSPPHGFPSAAQVGDEHSDDLERRAGEPTGEPGRGGARQVVEREVPLLHTRTRYEAQRRLKPVAHATVTEKVVPGVIRVEQAHARRCLRSGEIAAVRRQAPEAERRILVPKHMRALQEYVRTAEPAPRRTRRVAGGADETD